MRSLIIVCLGGLCVLADGVAAQDARPSAPGSALAEQVKIASFQMVWRGDNYGIASFVLSNGTDKKIDSVELTCWVDGDREHGTTVVVWASEPVAPHASQQFKNVNIGVVSQNSRSECEVTRAD